MLLILYFSFGHDKTFEVTPQQFSYKVASDMTVGGSSQANLNVERNKAIMFCRLADSDYSWPYC